MRKIFVFILAAMVPSVLFAQTDETQTSGGIGVETFSDIEVVKDAGEYMVVNALVDVPTDYPELQAYICSKLFDVENKSLQQGYLAYLSRYEVQKDQQVISDVVSREKPTSLYVEIVATGYMPDCYLTYDAIIGKTQSALHKMPDDAHVLKKYHVLFDLSNRKVMGYRDVFASDEFAFSFDRKKDWNFALIPSDSCLYAAPEGEELMNLPLNLIANGLTDNFKRFIDWDKIGPVSDTHLITSSAYLKMDEDVCRLVCGWGNYIDINDITDEEINALIRQKELRVIGREIRFAKDYMKQLADMEKGNYVKDENSVYEDASCEERARISSYSIMKILSQTIVPSSTMSIFVKILMEKDGSLCVPILQSSKHLYIFVDTFLVSGFREYMSKCHPAKHNGKRVRTVVNLELTRNNEGKSSYFILDE